MSIVKPSNLILFWLQMNFDEGTALTRLTSRESL